MYNQTASLLDSCAHNAGRAEGPPIILQALALLAARLAAVARLRAVHCLRGEGQQQVGAFRAALERASGETYQRPSPSDSNTSTALSAPMLEVAGSGNGSATGPRSHQPAAGAGSGSAGSPPVAPRRSTHAAAGAAAPPPPSSRAGSVEAAGPSPALAPLAPLLAMPKPLLERQLVAAQHSQALLGALSALGRSGEQLREFMQRAAAQVRATGAGRGWVWDGGVDRKPHVDCSLASRGRGAACACLPAH